MAKIQWTEARTNHLVHQVRQRQAMGVTENAAIIEVAAEMELTYDSAYQRYRRAAKLFTPVPESRYPVYDNPRLPDGDYLCLGDLHAPYHDAAFINETIITAQDAGIKAAIVGGDWLDMHALSAWPEDFSPAPNVISGQKYNELREFADSLPDDKRAELLECIADSHEDNGLQAEIKSVREMLKQFAANFEQVYYVMGNHEKWLIRKLEKAIGGGELSALFLGNNPACRIIPYYWTIFESGGQPWRVTHPNGAGKGLSGLKLAEKYQANTIMFHNHHFSVRSTISGRFVGIEPGMCLDESRAHYVQVRDNGADKHVTGAVIIQDGKFRLLNKWTA